MKTYKIGLKVTGIVLGVVAVITVLAIVFSITLMPVIKYNVAVKNASTGNYVLAAKGMHEIVDYKDADRKFQEYVFSAGKKALESGDKQTAKVYVAEAAVSTADLEISSEAQKLLMEIENQE